MCALTCRLGTPTVRWGWGSYSQRPAAQLVQHVQRHRNNVTTGNQKESFSSKGKGEAWQWRLYSDLYVHPMSHVYSCSHAQMHTDTVIIHTTHTNTHKHTGNFKMEMSHVRRVKSRTYNLIQQLWKPHLICIPQAKEQLFRKYKWIGVAFFWKLLKVKSNSVHVRIIKVLFRHQHCFCQFVNFPWLHVWISICLK